MSGFFDRVLMAYRPLYLRGLLMDGQYKLPVAPPEPPHGKRAAAPSRASTSSSGLAAAVAITAAARHPLQGSTR